VSSIDVIDPAYFAKEAKGRTASVEESKKVARRVTMPWNEVGHGFDDKEDGRVEKRSDCEGGGKDSPRDKRTKSPSLHFQNKERFNKIWQSMQKKERKQKKYKN